MHETGGQPATVAIISAVSPYPRDAGKKVVLAGLVDYWVARLGAEHVHYVVVDDGAASLREMPVEVHRVARPSAREQLLSLSLRTVLTARHAIQESMLYAPRVRRELQSALASIHADLEIFDTVRLAQYAGEIPAQPYQRRVVYLDDLFSVRYERMLTVMRSHPGVKLDPLGEFRANIPAALARVAGWRAAQRVLLETERRLVARREQAAARAFDTALLVNADEAATLGCRAGVGTVRSIPPVVDVSSAERQYDGRPTFVMLGLLTLPHNHDAALSFLTEVMPEVVRRMPAVRLHVVGRGASPELRAAAARFPDHVVVDGFVADLDGLLAGACALLAPLRFGSGVKIKVIEALARGVPVLATPFGAEGIRSGPEYGVIVEPSLDRYPERMLELVDLDRNAHVSSAARRHHVSTYAAEAAFTAYDDAFATTAVRSKACGRMPW